MREAIWRTDVFDLIVVGVRFLKTDEPHTHTDLADQWLSGFPPKPNTARIVDRELSSGCGSKLTGGANRRFWSMFPLARVPFWNSGFLSHSHLSLFFSWGAILMRVRTPGACSLIVPHLAGEAHWLWGVRSLSCSGEV